MDTKFSEGEASKQSLIQAARRGLCELPQNELHEIPGRPSVVYELRNYSGGQQGAQRARSEVPFLFKPFEVGQPPPPPPEVDRVPRQSTIHEYLDWTVTAAPSGPGEDLVSADVAQLTGCRGMHGWMHAWMYGWTHACASAKFMVH